MSNNSRNYRIKYGFFVFKGSIIINLQSNLITLLNHSYIFPICTNKLQHSHVGVNIVFISENTKNDWKCVNWPIITMIMLLLEQNRYANIINDNKKIKQ